jgi:hypothetical protein
LSEEQARRVISAEEKSAKAGMLAPGWKPAAKSSAF